MKSILFLVGSLRAESMNLRVARIAERMLPDGYQAVRFDLADVPVFNADLSGGRMAQCRPPGRRLPLRMFDLMGCWFNRPF